jgi:hypothetical protein
MFSIVISGEMMEPSMPLTASSEGGWHMVKLSEGVSLTDRLVMDLEFDAARPGLGRFRWERRRSTKLAYPSCARGQVPPGTGVKGKGRGGTPGELFFCELNRCRGGGTIVVGMARGRGRWSCPDGVHEPYLYVNMSQDATGPSSPSGQRHKDKPGQQAQANTDKLAFLVIRRPGSWVLVYAGRVSEAS